MTLLDRRLILVCGKGGVGRTTVAASIAAACARAGKKTLLYEANVSDRVGGYFDRPALTSEVAPLGDNLWGINTNPAAALHEYGLMILKFESVYEMVFENRVTKGFLRAIPGLDDYSIIGKLWWHTKETSRGEPTWDTVVFDMPASGHSLSMLKIPSAITTAVPESPLTRDAREIIELLRDPSRTGVVLVSLAEEMPANEAVELERKLGDLGIAASHLVVNQLFPNRFPIDGVASKVLDATLRSAPGGDVAALAAHSDLYRSRRHLNQRYLDQLKKTIKGKVAELPYLFVPQLGATEIGRLSAELARQL